MTYVDDSDVNMAVFRIIEGVIVPIAGTLSPKTTEDVADSIKSIIGQYMGLRTEDGESRVYEITQLEGEPYVMDA